MIRHTTKCEYCGTHFRVDLSKKTDDCPNCGAPAPAEEESPYAYPMFTASSAVRPFCSTVSHSADYDPFFPLLSPYGANE